jgi:putative intracellular protease/amidase
MGKVLCFVSPGMADFEVTLAFHKIKTVGKREVVSVGYDLETIESESGLLYRADALLSDAMNWTDIEALIIPGGPIRSQGEELSRLIRHLDSEGKLLAAICNGPQYLGRAGVLEDRKFTTSCSVERIERLGVSDPFPRHNYVESRVVRDGHVITAKGRAFLDFTFTVFDYLKIYENCPEEQLQLWNDIKDL